MFGLTHKTTLSALFLLTAEVMVPISGVFVTCAHSRSTETDGKTLKAGEQTNKLNKKHNIKSISQWIKQCCRKVLWLISELRAIMKSGYYYKIIMAKRIYDNDTCPISIEIWGKIEDRSNSSLTQFCVFSFFDQ